MKQIIRKTSSVGRSHYLQKAYTGLAYCTHYLHTHILSHKLRFTSS